MKKVISFILVIALVFTTVPSFDVAAAKSPAKTPEGQELFEFIRNKQHATLIKNSCYDYTKFVEDFRTNVPEQYMMGMENFFTEKHDYKRDYSQYYEPDKKKYMEVLTNIIAIYDMDNADKITGQKERDNLKSLKEYGLDALKMLDDTLMVATGMSGDKSKIKEIISDAVGETSFGSEKINESVEKISLMETLLQTYIDSYEFLDLVEKNSKGELKKAAADIKSAITETTYIRIDCFNEVQGDANNKYMGHLFCEGFFDAVKQTEEYEKNEAFKSFTDSGDEAFSKFKVLKASWDLGVAIGKMVGNLIVGGEDLENRIMEMEAVYDIGNIVKDELMTQSSEFLNHIGSKDESKYVNEYIAYSDYLVGCRIRGEYCLKSIVVSDAKLLSWFNMKNREEAESRYKAHADGIMNIQKAIDKIRNVSVHKYKNKNKVADSGDWKKTMLDYLKNEYEVANGMGYGFKLIYLNNDDIPELYEGGPGMIGGRIVTIKDNKTVLEDFEELNLEYIEKEGLVLNGVNRPGIGAGCSQIYRMEDGKLNKIFDGEYYDPEARYENDLKNGNFELEYKIDGKTVSEEYYKKEQEKLYPGGMSEDLSGANLESADSIIRKIRNM